MFGPGTIFIASYELKADDLDAVADELDQVIEYGPRMMRGPHLNRSDRRKRGMSQTFLDELSKW